MSRYYPRRWSPLLRTWPAAHVHGSGDHRHLTSPVPGVGPRLLESLAVVTAGEGSPAVALRALVAGDPFPPILRPPSILIQCLPHRHWVTAREGDLDVYGHGVVRYAVSDVDVDGERAAYALAGLPVPPCFLAFQRWRSGSELGGALRHLYIVEVARRWLVTGADLSAVDEEIASGTAPAGWTAAGRRRTPIPA